ncbi:metal-dependent transcriptional regulator [Austwickia chelonae]|uniref:metal-dependent transcriptional regulator n=1 Tax=Austwickia chelonae TaxID=100225 RepID=UPI000E21D904|nr:metal-dependent transcriptional regulator [Austwickia chelonae]
MTELIDTTEMYLRIIFELEEEGTAVLRARIVDRLGHSGPTVSQTVARMERDGLLAVQPDRSLLLSEEGRRRATRVMRKHRLAERLLVDVIGLEYEYVHAEACRWEHVMSDRVERKILALLDSSTQSPYGNPIPGLDELGVEPGKEVRAVVVPLASLHDRRGGHVEVRRLGEALQDDAEILGMLQDVGVVPEAHVRVSWTDEGWRIGSSAESDLVISRDVAAQIWVTLPQRYLNEE